MNKSVAACCSVETATGWLAGWLGFKTLTPCLMPPHPRATTDSTLPHHQGADVRSSRMVAATLMDTVAETAMDAVAQRLHSVQMSFGFAGVVTAFALIASPV